MAPVKPKSRRFSPVVLRETRLDKFLEQRRVAEGVGVSPQAYNQWEMGRTIPRLSNIVRLADFFGVEPTSFYFDEDAA